MEVVGAVGVAVTAAATAAVAAAGSDASLDGRFPALDALMNKQGELYGWKIKYNVSETSEGTRPAR